MRFAIFLFAALPPSLCFAQMPDGEPAVASQQIVHLNFKGGECPLFVKAVRFGDNSIRAICNNRERFRVYYMKETGQTAAARCSALEKRGIFGC